MSSQSYKNRAKSSHASTSSNLCFVLLYSKFTLKFWVQACVNETIFGRRWYLKQSRNWIRQDNFQAWLTQHHQAWSTSWAKMGRAESGLTRVSWLSPSLSEKHQHHSLHKAQHPRMHVHLMLSSMWWTFTCSSKIYHYDKYIWPTFFSFGAYHCWI